MRGDEMVAQASKTIRLAAGRLGYKEACELARLLAARAAGGKVLLDLGAATRTSTAALARLVLLRRQLLARGDDLGVVGLRGQPRALHEISRLGKALPVWPEGDTE